MSEAVDHARAFSDDPAAPDPAAISDAIKSVTTANPPCGVASIILSDAIEPPVERLWGIPVEEDPMQPPGTFRLKFESARPVVKTTALPPAVQTPPLTDGMKATNPKDAIGSGKLPMHLWPTTATIQGALALLDGALKYGRSNWRAAGVRYSVYYDAARRHLDAALEGEDVDPDSGLPHEAHVLACMAIIVDARAAGELIDDRAYNGKGYRPMVNEATAEVARLKAKHADKSPKHYTITDNEGDA